MDALEDLLTSAVAIALIIVMMFVIFSLVDWFFDGGSLTEIISTNFNWAANKVQSMKL